MEGNSSDPAKGPSARRDMVLLLLALLFVAGLRVWQICHTEVTARDSIGYIRIAWRLEHADLRETLRNSLQHPCYPAAILATSLVVRPWFRDDLPAAMQLSSQIVSACASLVLLILMFFLGRELFEPRIALGAAVLFQVLPATGRILADGLAEPLFLVFATASFWSACVGLRRRSCIALGGSGLFGGLAYLTRPEGGLIVAATGAVLLGTALVPRLRTEWRQWAACTFALGGAALVVALPYMAIIGGVTVKPTARAILRRDATFAPVRAPVPYGLASDTQVLAVWAVFKNPDDLHHLSWELWALGHALVTGSFYFGWLAALIGWWHWRVRAGTPGAWVMILTAALLGTFLFKVAATFGYISDRHTILILMIGAFWAVAGLDATGRWLARRFVRGPWAEGSFWFASSLMLLGGLALPRTAASLHGDRMGFRQAGAWLAANTCPGDYVSDAYCWSHYYAGRVFLEDRSHLPRKEPAVHFVVFERSANKHSRLQVRSERQLRNEGGRVLASWPVRRGKEVAEICVYEVPGPLPSVIPNGTAETNTP